MILFKQLTSGNLQKTVRNKESIIIIKVLALDFHCRGGRGGNTTEETS